MRSPRAQLGLFAAGMLGACLLISSCGGGGGGTPPPKPPPPPLSITTESLPEGIAEQSYTYSLTATGGTPPYSWRLAEDSAPLPPGLTLGWNGHLSGSPSLAGDFSFTVQVRDTERRTATRSLSLVVRERLRFLGETELPSAFLNEPYSYTLEGAVGGIPPYIWTLTSGYTLPPGLELSSSGVISGTPTAQGSWWTSLRVEDSGGQSLGVYFSFSVVRRLSIATTTLPDANIGIYYAAGLEAAGGMGQYTWSLEPGSELPTGLSFSEYGYIGGTPSVIGHFNLTVTVTDYSNPPQTASQALTLFVDNRVAIPYQEPPRGVVTKPYSYTFQAVGGTPPYTWTLLEADPPGIFTIDPATGQLTGIPQEQVGHFVRIQVQDASNPPQSATGDFWIYVAPLPYFETLLLPDGAQEVEYYTFIYGGGGLPPYTLRLVSGELPPGLSFQEQADWPSFQVTGTPTAVGTYEFTLELNDSSLPPTPVTQTFTMRINERLRITTTSLPEGNVGDFYLASLEGTGGVPPYQWWAYLPQGLLLDPSTGSVTGVPQTSYDGSVSVWLYDSGFYQQSASVNFPLRINSWLRLRTSRLPNARVGAPYGVTLTATGGMAPYSWSITSGSLPEGLSLDAATGQISGRATAAGSPTFTVRVQDSSAQPQEDSRTLTLTTVESPGRNDSIETATPISNGTFRASISPYADPIDGPGNPDSDYYVLPANAGAVVTVETMARRLYPESPLDSVIEIVDAEGVRFATCRPPGSPYGPFDRPCLNDDIQLAVTLDSKLEFQVPGEPGTPVTFYVRVLDWRGSARPDFVYDLLVSGAN